MEKNKIVERQTTELQEENPTSKLIQFAIEKGADLEKLEKLLAIKERYDAMEAKKVFALDFASAQAEIQAITKTKINPQTHSKYANLSDIIINAQPIYTKFGFSVIFYEGETAKPDCIRICADILHKAGHKESYWYDMPLDGTGIKGNVNMTRIHGKSSSTSYARRYLLCMIWNIATEDDDGNDATEVNYITNEQLNIIRDLLIDADIKEVAFLKFMGIESCEKMLESDYQKAVTAIKAKKEAKAGKK